MPRPSQWELFDKFFYPDAKRIEQSDKPRKMQGSRIAYAVVDEVIEMENKNEAQDRILDHQQDAPRPPRVRLPSRYAA
ncbi:hypothetical protein SEA_CATERPILLAR_56 [Arthrobacter phage Caterpillar]|nr:hypothetical protein SEA_CATERPILLAR_56 [Arthrobacter phage Caterpillar]